MLIPMELYNNKAQFVVDTGAAVTIMASHVYNAIPSSMRPELKQPDEHLKLEVANDSLLDIQGSAKFLFTIGKSTFEWDMYVAPIREDGLIGLDFLYSHNYVLSAEKGLKLDGNR